MSLELLRCILRSLCMELKGMNFPMGAYSTGQRMRQGPTARTGLENNPTYETKVATIVKR